MDVNGVLVVDGGTGLLVVWRMIAARGRNILYKARGGGGGASAGVSGAWMRCVRSRERHFTLEA
jgi:hypothetical protein